MPDIRLWSKKSLDNASFTDCRVVLATLPAAPPCEALKIGSNAYGRSLYLLGAVSLPRRTATVFDVTIWSGKPTLTGFGERFAQRLVPVNASNYYCKVRRTSVLDRAEIEARARCHFTHFRSNAFSGSSGHSVLSLVEWAPSRTDQIGSKELYSVFNSRPRARWGGLSKLQPSIVTPYHHAQQ
jgi:hypothetical protein